MTYFHQIGKATAVNNTRVDLWDTAAPYVFPPAGGIQMQVSSASTNDASNGTGAREVELHYLDHLYHEREELITLNGTNAVLTVATDILRVQDFHASVVGSVGVPVGKVSLTSVGGSVTYSYLEAGLNMARVGVWTVPAGMVAYLCMWHGSSGTTSGSHYTEFELRAQAHEGEAYPLFLLHEHLGTLNSGRDQLLPVPLAMPEKADIKISVVSDASNANAACVGGFMGYYQPV